MNIEVINEISNELNKIENSVMMIESKIHLVAPDLYSNIETKKSLIEMMRLLLQVKDDFGLYRNGKALKSQKDIIASMIQKSGKNPIDFGFGGPPNNLPDKPMWD